MWFMSWDRDTAGRQMIAICSILPDTRSSDTDVFGRCLPLQIHSVWRLFGRMCPIVSTVSNNGCSFDSLSTVPTVDVWVEPTPGINSHDLDWEATQLDSPRVVTADLNRTITAPRHHRGPNSIP